MTRKNPEGRVPDPLREQVKQSVPGDLQTPQHPIKQDLVGLLSPYVLGSVKDQSLTSYLPRLGVSSTNTKDVSLGVQGLSLWPLPSP